jgi:hypothetical protein
MKTSVSIADDLFAQADDYARERGWTRSEVYARALREYLVRQREQWVTEQYDRVYGDDPEPASRVFAAQREALEPEDWSPLAEDS